MHVSKPWWEKELLIVNAINSTAGLFAGDEIENEVEVKSGASMLLTSPSASRVHRMIAGRAFVRQTMRVDSGGWLEVWPALFIPHADSNYRQETTVSIEEGARFLWSETFAPGRVASGEAWKFTRFENRFEMRYGRCPVAIESYSLMPGAESVQAICDRFPAGCHGTCYAVGAEFTEELLREISGLHEEECWVGCTRLDAPAIAVRAVAVDNLRLTRVMAKIREIVHGGFGRSVPSVRRA